MWVFIILNFKTKIYISRYETVVLREPPFTIARHLLTFVPPCNLSGAISLLVVIFKVRLKNFASSHAWQ
jgi:hypothetical protein